MIRSQESTIRSRCGVILCYFVFRSLEGGAFIYLRMCGGGGMPWLTCGGHRAACKSWFLLGSNLSHQGWQQVPLPAEPT